MIMNRLELAHLPVSTVDDNDDGDDDDDLDDAELMMILGNACENCRYDDDDG